MFCKLFMLKFMLTGNIVVQRLSEARLEPVKFADTGFSGAYR